MRPQTFQIIVLLSATSILANPSLSDLSNSEETKVELTTVDDSASPPLSLSDGRKVSHSLESPQTISSNFGSAGASEIDPIFDAEFEDDEAPMGLLAIDFDFPLLQHQAPCEPHLHHSHCGGKHGHHRYRHHRHHRHSKYALFNNDIPARMVAKDILKGYTHPRVKDLAFIIELARAFINEHEEYTEAALEKFRREGDDGQHHSFQHFFDSGLKKSYRWKKILREDLYGTEGSSGDHENVARDP
jgi:hypothetical protein